MWRTPPPEDDRLFVRDLAGGDPIEIYHDESIYSVRWSPTGEELLVGASSDREGRYLVVRLPRLGGPAEEFPFARWFAWSPDAQAFAFAYYQPYFLFIRDLTSSRIDSIALPDDYDVLLDLDWSPAGDRLSMILHEEPSRFDLWTIDRSGEPARRIVQDSVELLNPRWSQDGAAIYYLRPVHGSMDLLKVELSTAGDASSQPMHIANLRGAISFEMFADDRGVSYIGTQGHSNLSLISLKDSGSSVITPLTTGTAFNTGPALSPDGQRVAFTRWAGNEGNIHLLDLDAGSSRQITFLAGPICCPVWSPDGREIAFFSSTGGEPRIWKVGSDGGAPVPLSPVSMKEPFIQWAPGPKILVHSSYPAGITLLDPENGRERSLPASIELPWMHSPRVSPDGTRIAGSSNRAIVIVSLVDGTYRNRDTSLHPTVLTWSTDGEWVYAFEADSSAIMRYSISGPEVEVVLKVDCKFVESATSDGTRFICTSYEHLLDLWLARNLPASVPMAAGDRD